MSSGWSIERILGWLDDLPEYVGDYADADEELEALNEFDVVRDVLELYESQVNAYLKLRKKPPAAMTSAVMSISDSLEDMPFCIYDVLHARMLLNVEHDCILQDGNKYRIGVPVERLTEKMSKITRQIRSKKENE